MADAPRGAQACCRRHHRSHQLVGVQAAFHQRLDLAGARHRDCALSGRMAVFGIDDAVSRDIDLLRFCCRADLRLGPDQHRHDQLAPRGLEGAEQRVAIARVNDRARDRFNTLAALEQVREGVVVSQNDLRRCDLVIDNALLRSLDGDGAAGNAPPACIDVHSNTTMRPSRFSRGVTVATISSPTRMSPSKASD